MEQRYSKQGPRFYLGFTCFPRPPGGVPLLAIVLMACGGMALDDRAITTLDAIQDTAQPLRQSIVLACHGAEWAIVGRDSTAAEDLVDLADVRKECDELYSLWDAWAAMDGVIRQTVQSGSPQDAIKLLPELRKTARALHKAATESSVLRRE